MAWYDEAVFYHIYPLGLSGAPKHNEYAEPVHRLRDMKEWIGHIKGIGCNALYIGPLFESVGHGYETTDYKKLDSRLGDNEDLKDFVSACHAQGIRVIFDGVFNHTGRDFFAFADIRANRENSPYKDWYCNVNFWGNNSYNDGFSYENWGGYDLLAKLNQHNPAVRDYICDVIRFWVSEFDVDGIRLDAADVMDFSYMQALRQVANEVKPDFWLMGEVIHGDYTRWANDTTLHAVTNYNLHKALYSGHNDHNYFEIAHTVKRLYEMGQGRLKLYNFTDNHDVERIYTKLTNKAHFAPVHILTYTLPGVPSIYYGSEFGIEGRKEQWSDDSLRPCLNLADFKDAKDNNPCTKVLTQLGNIRQNVKALSYGDYRELLLTNRQYAFSRNIEGSSVVVTVNNDDNDYTMTLPAGNCGEYIGALSGQRVSVSNGTITVNVRGNYGDVWVPAHEYVWESQSEETKIEENAECQALEPVEPELKPEFVENYERCIAEVGAISKNIKALSYGDYRELLLTDRQYAFSRNIEGSCVVVSLNNDTSDYVMTLPAGDCEEYIGALSGQRVRVVNGNIVVNVKANYGDIWVPYHEYMWICENTEKVDTEEIFEDEVVSEEEIFENDSQENAISEEEAANIDNLVEDESFFVDEEVAVEESNDSEEVVEAEMVEETDSVEPEVEVQEEVEKEPTAMELAQAAYEKAFEEGKIAGLQEAIIARMERNGYVTDQMRQDVYNQTHIGSLINWIKSF